MTQPPVLTGQDIAEAEGAVQGVLEHALAGTGTTSREYVVLRVLAVRGPVRPPASLHDFLDTLEADCNEVGEAIAAEYFWGRSPLRRGA